MSENNTNGFFGMIQSPFTENEQLMNRIREQNQNNTYLSKVGIVYVDHHSLNIDKEPQIRIKINNKDFTLGKTGMLEFEDVKITSIKFLQDIEDDKVYIDYQYINE